MNLLVTGQDIQRELSRLIGESKHFDWSVAWASHASECFTHLIEHKSKINRLVVGTHFYQTHPQFLKEFIGNRNVRIIQKPSGIFHPKVYYFEHENGGWESIVGSPNFTKSAFEANEEIAVLIDSKDENSLREISKVKKRMNSYWESASPITSEYVTKYEALWKSKKVYVKKLSGSFGRGKPTKENKYEDEFLGSGISTLGWNDYFQRVSNDDQHSLEGRVQVISQIRDLFEEYQNLQNMSQIDRKKVAGLLTENDIDWKWFGSMVGSGKFKNRINENNEYLSLALDCIPLNGEVFREDYSDFLEFYMMAFPDGKNPLATASRLLAMKRPDYFICLDSANKEKFCKDFSLQKSALNLDNYWDEIIERIKECVWWNSHPPKEGEQRAVWDARSAFLDALYYVPN